MRFMLTNDKALTLDAKRNLPSARKVLFALRPSSISCAILTHVCNAQSPLVNYPIPIPAQDQQNSISVLVSDP
jgi:hypothetical protein